MSGNYIFYIEKSEDKKEVFLSIREENREVILHGENRKNKKELIETVHNFISAIQVGNFKIVDRTVKIQPETKRKYLLKK